jgi:glutathione S-transferase
MKLYFTPGACSLSPHIVLRELGLAFELEKVDLAAKRTASGADFRTINPKGYVPALGLAEGEILTEGAAIVQFLADQHPQAGLAPAPGTIERARLQAYLNFLSSELHKAFGPLFNPALPAADREAAKANIARRYDLVEQGLADERSYLLGEAFSVADAYLFTISSWAAPTGVDLSPWPHVQALVARVASRPAVRAALEAEGLTAKAA